MSAPIVVPFDFNPVSTSVKTGTFVIPAGQYAYVAVQARNSGYFAIDGVIALNTSAEVITAVNTTTSHAVSASGYFEGVMSNSSGGAGTYTIAGITYNVALGENVPVKTGPGVTITITGGTMALTGWQKVGIRKDAEAFYWVPSGTSLTVSGDVSYAVSLFNEKT